MKLLVLLLSGCFHAQYLAQAARGQFELVDKKRPIERVLQDSQTPPAVKRLLAEVAPMKAFAEAHGLKPTGNYTEYTDLHRQAAVWVVSACHPLQFRSKTWTFPIVGTVPYLGFFRLNDAKEYANTLKAEGYDVSLRTASAYSTLGWFNDPVLSTMLLRGPDAVGDLANTVFHESLHATLYVKGKTLLSESVATFVGDEMARDYLQGRPELQAYLQQKARSEEVAVALHATFVELKALYESTLSDDEKRRRKGETLMRLRQQLGLRIVVNNALLMEYRSYTSGQSALATQLARFERNWPRFIRWLMPLQNYSGADSMSEALKALR